MFANPADQKHRFDLTVRLSYDEGKTWAISRLIKKGTGAYSSMTVFPDGTIGIIYETGNNYDGIVEY
ncbi:MAG: glycoside hydrolase [Verrucomicrobiales bacterium]|nr:glycoside hydrolase [Verrucomicrobiales bacterium]